MNGSAPAKGKAPIGAFPLAVLLFTAALAAAGVAGALLAKDVSAVGQAASWPTVLTFLVLLTIVFPTLHFQYRDQVDALDLFEAVLVPAIFVLSPLQAVAVVGVALAVSETLQRIHPVKACFNVAQWMAATAAGSLVLAALRDGSGPPTSRDLLVLAAAMVVTMVVNDLALIGALWLAGPQPLPGVLKGVKPLVVPVWIVGGAINLSFGMLFLAAYLWSPLTAGLFLVPLAMLHWSGRAYASVRADRARLAGMQRATHALAVPMNPRDAVPDFLAEVRRCFESEVAELVIVLEGHRVVHRTGEDPTGDARWVEEAGQGNPGRVPDALRQGGQGERERQRAGAAGAAAPGGLAGLPGLPGAGRGQGHRGAVHLQPQRLRGLRGG